MQTRKEAQRLGHLRQQLAAKRDRQRCNQNLAQYAVQVKMAKRSSLLPEQLDQSEGLLPGRNIARTSHQHPQGLKLHGEGGEYLSELDVRVVGLLGKHAGEMTEMTRFGHSPHERQKDSARGGNSERRRLVRHQGRFTILLTKKPLRSFTKLKMA
jgi:hypothetical protein